MGTEAAQPVKCGGSPGRRERLERGAVGGQWISEGQTGSGKPWSPLTWLRSNHKRKAHGLHLSPKDSVR